MEDVFVPLAEQESTYEPVHAAPVQGVPTIAVRGARGPLPYDAVRARGMCGESRMNAVSRLKRDHGIFRSKLNVLESALHIGSKAWFVLRETCVFLEEQLEDHARREEELSFALHSMLCQIGSPGPFVDHALERRQAALINQSMRRDPNAWFARMRPTVARFISDFRARIDQQEFTVLPALEEAVVLSEMEQLFERSARPSWALSEAMTVGEVVDRYPAAGPMLEQLFIDQRFERYDCLDEVAWRHGMESWELVSCLETAYGGSS